MKDTPARHIAFFLMDRALEEMEQSTAANVVDDYRRCHGDRLFELAFARAEALAAVGYHLVDNGDSKAA